MKLFGGAGATKTPKMAGRAIELDFVRGIAIIMVMGYHFHAVHTGNYLIQVIEYPLKSFGCSDSTPNLAMSMRGVSLSGGFFVSGPRITC
jgi:uncharacterized membrane protein